MYNFYCLGKDNTIPCTSSRVILNKSQIRDIRSCGIILIPPHANSHYNLTKQSFPFSYLALTAAANDGSTHSVAVYSDISGEWLSGNTSLAMNWTTTTGDTLVHQAQLQDPSPFAEIDDRTQCTCIYSRPILQCVADGNIERWVCILCNTGTGSAYQMPNRF